MYFTHGEYAKNTKRSLVYIFKAYQVDPPNLVSVVANAEYDEGKDDEVIEDAFDGVS